MIKHIRTRNRFLLILASAILVGVAGTIANAQGDVSAQVLRLLSRTNYWSGLNTIAQTMGLKFERGVLPPALSVTDRVYNVNGVLYFNGSPIGSGSGVSSITAGSGISITGTATVPIVGLSTTTVTEGRYTNTNLTVDAYGRVTTASNGSSGSGVPSSRTITATTPVLIDGGASADLSANRTLSLAVSGITATTYGDSTHVAQCAYSTLGIATRCTDVAIAATTAGHTILSATHTDTVPAAVVRGDLMVGNSTPLWARLARGSANYFLSNDGADVVWSNNGSQLTNLNAANVLSGSLADARLSANVVLYDFANTNAPGGQGNTGILWHQGQGVEGTPANWEFTQRTDNAIAQLTLNNPGTNGKGASPSGYSQILIHAQQEDLDMMGSLAVFPNNYGGPNDNNHHTPVPQGVCSVGSGGRDCPTLFEISSTNNLRLATTSTAMALDFWINDRSLLTMGQPGSMAFYFSGAANAPITGTSNAPVAILRNRRLYGVDNAGLETYALGPTGMEIGGNYTSRYNPPRWPGDASDNLANATWANGSLRVAGRLGVGCGPSTTFMDTGSVGHPTAGLCVEPGPNGNEIYGAEVWGPQRSGMTVDIAALRLDTTDSSTSGRAFGSVIYAGGSANGNIGSIIQGVSTGGTDYGLWIDWQDQNAEYLIRVQASGLDRFLLKNTGANFGAATNAGAGCGFADNTCGNGSINVAGDLFRNGSAYNNPSFVFEKEYTGQIVQFADRAKAAGMADYAGLRPLEEVQAFTKTHYDLPLMAQQYHAGMFQRGDQLMAAVEEAYLYLFQLQARVDQLERQLAGKQTDAK